jgi:hypothetical protein
MQELSTRELTLATRVEPETAAPVDPMTPLMTNGLTVPQNKKKCFPSEKSREHVLGLLMIYQYLSIFISFSFRMSTPLLDL